MTVLPAAVLWDLDGTIIDSEPYWMHAETQLVGEFGGTWTHENALTLVGQGLWYTARVLRGQGVAMEDGDIVEALTSSVLQQFTTRGLPWRPGARELLLELREREIPTALVTMSLRRLALRVDEAIGFPAFDHVVAGDDVEHSKPHPAAYLRAAELLGVDPRDCIALEDSPPGITAAIASGATTIGIPLHAPLIEDDRYTLWPTLVERKFDDLVTVMTATRTRISQ